MPHPKSGLHKEVNEQTTDKKRRISPRSRKRRVDSTDHQRGFLFGDRTHSDHRLMIWEGPTVKSRTYVGDCLATRRENEVPTQTDPLVVPSFIVGTSPHGAATGEHLRRKPNHTSVSALPSGPCQSDSQLLRKSQAESGRPGVVHLSHEQFSAIADQLVSKMKQELCIESVAPCRGDSPTSSVWEKLSESTPSEFCSAPEDASEDEEADEAGCVSSAPEVVPGLLSHYCVICASHMMPPAYAPMLLVPCGHTICRTCSRSRDDCPVCHCAVSLTNFNVLLQQIVIDYKRQQAAGGAVQAAVTKAKDVATQSGITSAKECAKCRHQPTAVFSEGGPVVVRTSPRDYQRRHLTMKNLDAEANTISTLVKQLELEMEVYSTELRCLDEQESQLQAKMDDLAKTMRTTKQEREALRLKRQATEDEYVTGKMRLDIIRETLAELRKDDDKTSDKTLLVEATSSGV